ncbi:hypothetical protein AAC387_Pa01g2427 [Persea americana]
MEGSLNKWYQDEALMEGKKINASILPLAIDLREVERWRSKEQAVTDPIVEFEEEPRDSGVDPESSPADLPQDSDDFESSMDATFDDASDEFMEAKSIPPVVEEGCEATGEVPLSFSGPEQGVHAVDPGVGASSTSFDEAEESPCADIPSRVAPIGKSFLITLPMVHDMGSRPTEHGESSSGPSLQFAKKVLKRVLSSWVETLSSVHLEVGFSMIKHVQDILVDSEEVGLDITNAKAFVDEVIALGNKWTETKSFPNGDFFNEMFVKPSSEVKSEVDVIEARQRLELLEEQAAAKWTAIVEARAREGTLIRQVEEAKSNLRRKTQEYEQCQILWEELPRAKDGSQQPAAFYGKILKKRGLEALEAKAKSLLEELSLWLKTMSD